MMIERAAEQIERGPRKNAGTSLRVLFINDTSRNGGPGRTLLDIVKFLDPTSIDRTLLIPRAGVVSQLFSDSHAIEHLIVEPDLVESLIEPLSRQMERKDFDAPFLLKFLRGAANIVRILRGVVRLVRRVRAEKYDFVFCNGTAANFIGGVIARLTGIPVIWHVLYPSVAPAIRGIHRFLAASRGVRLIVCVSQATAGQFSDCSQKVQIIHDALDIEEFDREAAVPRLRSDLFLSTQTTIFGSHGRILPRKGFKALIQAAQIVFEKLSPDDRERCRFVIVGDTPQDVTPDHLEECRILVRELGLTGFVLFLGFRPDVRPYVAEFDVAVVPSVYEDPLPRAVMESMALGKPVVAFAVGGIPEMIDDGATGLLVQGLPPDIKGLADACLRYFHSPQLRLSHGVAGRRKIEQEFDARSHAQALQEMMIRSAAPDSRIGAKRVVQ